MSKASNEYHRAYKEMACTVCGKLFTPTGNRQKFCSCECKRIERINRDRLKAKQQGRREKRGRYSGKVYVNSQEKLDAIKEKYKNGIPAGTIEAMVCGWNL